jgi:CNT family concentrative nucleoside transporter
MEPQGLVGIAVIVLSAYLLSDARSAIRWRSVAFGVLAALLIGFSFSRLPLLVEALIKLNALVTLLEESAQHGASFIFGYLAGGATPFEVSRPENSFIIAFRVFPLILIVTVLSNIALHSGVLGLLIRGLSVPVKKIFGLSSPLALGAAASVFFGTIETPLVIKAWLKGLSRGEFLALVTCTMSTIAGTVMVLYAGLLKDVIPGALGHMMVASLMSVPCAISIALVLSPFEAATQSASAKVESPYEGLGDAIASGVQEGLMMILSITATLIVVFGLVYFLNKGLSLIPGFTSLQEILALPLKPLLWSVGVPWSESSAAAQLMANKVVLNEFVAYLQLPQSGLSDRSALIVTYALCGFANLGSLGIVVAGLGQLVPERKREVAAVCARALLAGNFATLLTAALISLVTP